MGNNKNRSINKPETKSFGNERRRNLSYEIMDNANPFPKPITYKDIDQAMMELLESEVDIVYEGEKLPSRLLLSNQRFGEYTQSWQYMDNNGSPYMNFKTLYRENNPSQGTQFNNTMNIPNNQFYDLACLQVMEDTGIESYDLYRMKQPFSIDLKYTMSIFTNKYDLLNIMNEKIQNLFKSINHYIRVNGHFMPLFLENIADESEYKLDDRKFYSQSFTIKCSAYIIREEDLVVERIPKRVLLFINPNEKNKPQVYFEEKIGGDEINITFDQFNNNQVKFKVDEDLIITKIKLDNIRDVQIINFNTLENINLSKKFYLKKNDIILIKIKKDKLNKLSNCTFYI